MQPLTPSGERYDFASALVAVQAIACSADRASLLHTITSVFLDFTGGQCACLLQPLNGAWQAVFFASRSGGGSMQTTLPPLPGFDPDPGVLRQVQEKGIPVLEPLAASSSREYPPGGLSCLALPVQHQDETIGIIYLEGEFSSDLLEPEELEILYLLTTQAAFSLQNIELVQSLRLAEEKARASELRFQHLFENTPVCIFEMDISGPQPLLRAANRRAEAVYGWTEAEMLALQPQVLFSDDAGQKMLRVVEAVKAGETLVVEGENMRRDGSRFPARIISTPEVGPHVDHMVVAVEDITAEKQRRSETEAIEAERLRIAQEIHDGFAQDLAALRLKVSLWHEWLEMPGMDMHAEFDQLIVVLESGIEEIRRSIHALRPVALDEMGFFPALRDLVSEAKNQYPLQIDLDIHGPEESLPAGVELPLFRIIQEGLTNILKHARASRVNIGVDLTAPGEVHLQVEDNGRGFNLEEINTWTRSGHFGLKQIQERVAQAGGEMDLTSQPGRGTMLRVRLPFTQPSQEEARP
jgi:PAS domain S-box-containing protein